MNGDIYLEGQFFGNFGKARKFQADSWEEPEYLPAAHCWWTADPGAVTEGRGTMRIAGWLAKKNGWTEWDDA